VVVPNGTSFGDGERDRIKEELLKEFNLHTIVRLPNGVFAPYTSIPTNILNKEQRIAEIMGNIQKERSWQGNGWSVDNPGVGRFLHPFRVAKGFSFVFRGYRSAQPWADCHCPIGAKQMALAAPDRVRAGHVAGSGGHTEASASRVRRRVGRLAPRPPRPRLQRRRDITLAGRTSVAKHHSIAREHNERSLWLGHGRSQ
jgi:hypothetical protein